MKKVINDDLKNEIKKYYLSRPMTLEEVKKKYNLSLPTISKILKDVDKYKKAQIFNPNLKEHYFEIIDSEDKAYFLGLIIADGNVFVSNGGNRQASISITLDLKDEYMLLKFKECVNTNTNIGHDGRGCGTIAVRSNIMANELAQYGIVPRKTFIAYLPKVEDKYMSHLIRGIMDGDGSIHSKQSPRDDGHNRYLHSISFCGTYELMTNISDYIYKYLNLNVKPKVYKYKDKSLSEMKIQNINDMFKFGQWIYENSTIYLKRKKNIYNEFLNHYNLANKKI